MAAREDTKPLPGRALREDAQVTVAFEVLAYVTGTRAQLADLHQRASDALMGLYARCDANGAQLVQAHGEMRALRAEEAMAVIPRKKHLAGDDGRQICSTPHVAAKHIVTDEAAVTCRLCLNKIAESRT